ncbi:MAG: family 10 glycosylhydrolase [Bacteroidales bacterium]|nr:family 10 glycosylhydrolase [Bacteroidales bacterium]
MKRTILLIVAIVGCFSLQARKKEVDPRTFNVSKDSVVFQTEFRGAWLSTVESIDWPKVRILLKAQTRADGTVEKSGEVKARIDMQRDSQKRALVSLITKIKRSGCNAVMFQIVSNSDALYPSKILQWAPTLTDTPGEGPGYDPLALAIKTAHSLGMEIHGWINPLRIGKVTLPRREDNICYVKNNLVQEHNGMLYWDPGYQEVKDYLGELATEIMTKYDLDGLHIDDYFYPWGVKGKGEQVKPKKNEKVWNDATLFAKYGNGKTLDEWRESNINDIVRVLHTAVHKAKPSAVFGVSPAGRLVNTQDLYADPINWAKEGTIDYLIPQIYWQHGHEIADFKKVLDSWAGILGDTPVIAGLAAYRYPSKAFPSMDEFKLQVEECRAAPYATDGTAYNVVGECWFTTHNIITDEFTSYLLNNIYQDDLPTPSLGRDNSDISAPELTKVGGLLRWSEVKGANNYEVYRLIEIPDQKTSEGGRVFKAVKEKRLRGFSLGKTERGFNYFVVALKGSRRSERSNIIFVKE